MFYFHPYLGEWSILTNIFQMGWNHQLDKVLPVLPPIFDIIWLWKLKSDPLKKEKNIVEQTSMHVSFLAGVQLRYNGWMQ